MQNARDILRPLAERQAEIAALPVHKRTIEGWKRLNSLKPGKPMVWINEICWNEFPESELQCQIQDRFLREIERDMRRTIYQWEHLPVNMVVENVVYCPLAVDDSGFGIDEDVRIVKTDEANDVVSREFHPVIHDEKDLEKILTPVITHDAEESGRRYQILQDLIGDIIPIRKRGKPGSWFAPWDELIRWWGVAEAMVDLVERPELVHAAMDRLVKAYLVRLDQWEKLHLLELNNNNVRIGSGGVGYCDELPSANFDAANIIAADLWGSATAQIFSDVSPEMHVEFALNYERRWLDRFGLTYYGCCEPLHLKLGILQTVPNLRKISMSPWADIEKSAGIMQDRYVFSRKPSPAVLAEHTWDPRRAKDDLIRVLDRTRGCIVELIMKDISTVRYEPRRLWEWARIAAEVTQEYA